MAMTLLQIRDKIKLDTGISDSTIITDVEYNGLINDGIKITEAIIHNLYEDYFFTMEDIALTSGTQDYSLPSDIYANKIRRIIYNDSNTIYRIRKIKNLDDIPWITSGYYYSYVLINSSTDGMKLRFYPIPIETSLDHIHMYYIRRALELSSDSDECDIPEFTNFIIAYVKMKAYEKTGHFLIGQATEEYNELKELMVGTLQDRTDDEENKLIMDVEFYRDFNNPITVI